MYLRDLIDILESIPASATNNTLYGWGDLHSWRGDYDQLSLSDGNHTIGYALDDCVNALHAKFYGYKGGVYYMNDSTPVWGDNFGEYSGLQIEGIAFVLDKDNKTNPIAKVLRS
jgi:hypothetical protein